MSIFPNLIVTFNIIPTKITVRYFVFIDMNSKVYMEKQKTYKSQYNIEEEKQSCRTHTIQFQDLLLNYSIQEMVVLVQEQTHGLMD